MSMMLLAENYTNCSQFNGSRELAVISSILPHHESHLKLWAIRSSLVLLLLLFFTYITSSIRFRRNLGNSASREVPLVPYWIPGLFHTFALLDPAAFAFRLR